MLETSSQSGVSFFKGKRLLVLCLILLIIVGVFIGWPTYRKVSYFWHVMRVNDRIGSLRSQRPSSITSERWEEAVGWGVTAFANLWRLNPDDHPKLIEFSNHLDTMIAAGDSLATLRWVWDELKLQRESAPAYAADYMPVRAMNPDPITDENLGALWGLEPCNYLDLSGTEVTDDGLHHLQKAKQLKELYLGQTKVTDAGLATLAKISTLEGLDLADCKITGTGLKDLSGLQRLYLRGTEITDVELVHIAHFPDLLFLDLSRTQITGTGLEQLRDHKKLEYLYLNKSQISDAGLKFVGNLTTLKDLELNETNITDEGLAHLKNLKNLLLLRMEKTKVTNAGLVHLESLSKLHVLSLSSHLKDVEELKHLAQTLPDCEIRFVEETMSPAE